jgi:opacity protein-like surface antigen
MRWVLRAVFLIALAPSAAAADLDVLRGSQIPVGPARFTRWEGFYAGGQFNFSSSNVDFSKATQPLIADSLQQTALLNVIHPDLFITLGNNNNSTATGFGGFAGYNTQWQDLVLGVEANYIHAPFTTVATGTPVSRVASAGGSLYSVNVTGTGSLSMTDFGSLRGRVGYVFGNFLPYGFAGFAMGLGSYSITADVSGQQNSSSSNQVVPCTPNGTTCINYDFPSSTGKTSNLFYGFAVGGGFDWALTQNIFVRGEYEFLQFAPVANILAKISSARVGAGFKF